MTYTKLYKAYVLIDPSTNTPRYVGITQRSIQQRFVGHMNDIRNRPDLNKHKTAWFKQLLSKGLMPIIQQIAEFDTIEEMKQFEVDYITQYKEKYKLINQTAGGDWISSQAHSREAILKKKNTRAVVQWNVLGEKIAEYEIMEDVARTYNLREKACSHITGCCKHHRNNAYGYLWTYKGDPAPDFSKVNVLSLNYNTLVMYDFKGNRIKEFESYYDASDYVGDKSKGGNIAACVRGKQKTCNGYIFRIEPKYVYYNQSLFDKAYNKKYSKVYGYGQPVIQYDLNGNEIARYKSMTDAAKSLSKSTLKLIKECCQGIRASYKGYVWKFARLSINPSNSGNEPTWSIQS